MRGIAWLLVAVTSLVSGGWSIPLGFAFGLADWEVYVAAVVGSFVGMTIGVVAGDRLRAAVERRREIPTLDPDTWLGQTVDRHGARGLGLVGPLFPGVTIAILMGLAVGVPRRPLVAWMSVGVALLFLVYTVGLGLIIELVGLQ